MIAGALVMTVPNAQLLLAMGRADARIHVEHDAARRPSTVHQVDPVAGQVGQRGHVGRRCKPLRLEAAHLTWRNRTALRGLATDNPANRRIVTQTFGIVHVFVAGEPTEHRLPEQTDQRMATVLAGPRVGKHVACQRGQSKRVVKLAIGEQSCIGRNSGAAKLQRQAAVKIEPRAPDSDSPTGFAIAASRNSR
jgi:hypothetical protein